MSRRRRPALRQVAEPEIHAALSDVEDESPVAQPNFNLLGMMAAEPAAVRAAASPPPLASTQPVIYEDGDGDHDMDQASTQIVSSPTPNGSAQQPSKKARVAVDRAAPRSSTSSSMVPPVRAPSDPASQGVFQLYQKGLCDDHTLRLHFIRRRPPPPPASRIEDEFVLLRPEISVFDVLPSTMPSISDILARDGDMHGDPGSVSQPMFSFEEALETATTHWRQPTIAPADTVSLWRGLQECDWIEVYQRSGSVAPSPKDLAWLLQSLRSDAFAWFVWRELLVSTVQTLHRDQATPSEVSQFSAALVRHQAFRRLAAKEFRAQLRAKNLRLLVPHDTVDYELDLVAQFHNFRNSGG